MVELTANVGDVKYASLRYISPSAGIPLTFNVKLAGRRLYTLTSNDVTNLCTVASQSNS